MVAVNNNEGRGGGTEGNAVVAYLQRRPHLTSRGGGGGVGHSRFLVMMMEIKRNENGKVMLITPKCGDDNGFIYRRWR